MSWFSWIFSVRGRLGRVVGAARPAPGCLTNTGYRHPRRGACRIHLPLGAPWNFGWDGEFRVACLGAVAAGDQPGHQGFPRESVNLESLAEARAPSPPEQQQDPADSDQARSATGNNSPAWPPVSDRYLTAATTLDTVDVAATVDVTVAGVAVTVDGVGVVVSGGGGRNAIVGNGGPTGHDTVHAGMDELAGRPGDDPGRCRLARAGIRTPLRVGRCRVALLIEQVGRRIRHGRTLLVDHRAADGQVGDHRKIQVGDGCVDVEPEECVTGKRVASA